MFHHLKDTERRFFSLKDASVYHKWHQSVSSQLYSRRRLCRHDLRGTRQRKSSGRGAGRTCYWWTSLPLFPDSDTCRKLINHLVFSVEFGWLILQKPQQCVCVWDYRSAIATAVFFSLSLLDWGALTCAMTGLRSLFINSNTLSGFYPEVNEDDIDIGVLL